MFEDESNFDSDYYDEWSEEWSNMDEYEETIVAMNLMTDDGQVMRYQDI